MTNPDRKNSAGIFFLNPKKFLLSIHSGIEIVGSGQKFQSIDLLTKHRPLKTIFFWLFDIVSAIPYQNSAALRRPWRSKDCEAFPDQ